VLRIALFLFAFVIAKPFITLPGLAQSSDPHPSSIEILNKESSSSDFEGVRVYSQDLIQVLVDNSAGPAYAASLTDRLAQAEFMARHGKRKLISEADILQAFNALMKDIGAPDSLRTDIDAVRRARGAFESTSPALISKKTNGSYCNPGEAIFVIEMLIENVGISPAPPPAHALPQAVSGPKPPVRRQLEQYYADHSRAEIVSVLSHLFNLFQI
jgi:hypothetical protein